MNHKDLLKKYIQHVIDCEGSDFISSARTDRGMNDVVFTNEELSELKIIRDSIENEIGSFTLERKNNDEIIYSYIDNDGNYHKIQPPIDFVKHSYDSFDLSLARRNKKSH